MPDGKIDTERFKVHVASSYNAERFITARRPARS
jgi:hypothetical protein